ncbi:hypothetical protein ETB97_006617 [Aspergillus alliaceus]|uniref:Uncharacterized protein n=1 Tax=Petromyces alliaceus TaxID=209559 RepID=A0A8H6AAE8_PETAA|nr:hypothetical protein ETB97_006617 [Aspergillus burnettii]
MIFTDWLSIAEDWRESYGRFTGNSGPSQGFVSVDQRAPLHALSELLQQRGIKCLFIETEKWDLAFCWYRLRRWPDSVRGLELLSRSFRSAENFGAYKPSPYVYRGAAARFELGPSHCVMVAAHLDDLKSAKAQDFQIVYGE